MTAWWSGSAALFDTETDGKDPVSARLITACVAAVRPGSAPDVTNWIAQPERDIPAEAAGVHGISTERARAEGAPRAEVVEQVAAALAYGSAGPDGQWGRVPVVGHNLTYDLTLLDRELRRLRIGRLTIGFREHLGVEYVGIQDAVTVIVRGEPVGAFYAIDTMIVDKAIDTYRPGPVNPQTGEKSGGRNRLSTVAEFYGVPIRGDAHAADADALAAGRVAWVIAKRCAIALACLAEHSKPWAEMDRSVGDELRQLYRDRKRPAEIIRAFAALASLSLPELHEWQRRMAREQAESFREYCTANPGYAREKGIDVTGISGAWPLIPVADPSKPETVAAVSGEIL